MRALAADTALLGLNLPINTDSIISAKIFLVTTQLGSNQVLLITAADSKRATFGSSSATERRSRRAGGKRNSLPAISAATPSDMR